MRLGNCRSATTVIEYKNQNSELRQFMQHETPTKLLIEQCTPHRTIHQCIENSPVVFVMLRAHRHCYRAWLALVRQVWELWSHCYRAWLSSDYRSELALQIVFNATATEHGCSLHRSSQVSSVTSDSSVHIRLRTNIKDFLSHGFNSN